MIFERELTLHKLKAHDLTWNALKMNRVNKLNIIKAQQQANFSITRISEKMKKANMERRKTIRQLMRENVFVRNDICDVRDGLKDLIIANSGSPARIKQHLFPNAKPELKEAFVDKFMKFVGRCQR